jgi:hypothetical protein
MNYATQVGKPTAHITKKKSRLKVYNGNTVFLNDKDNFEFEIHNPKQKSVLVKIKLNGEYISTSGIVLRPGQRVFLERFLDSNNKFEFSTYEINNTSENRSAIDLNGDVRIEFYDEEELVRNNFLHLNSRTVYGGPTTNTPYPYYGTTLSTTGGVGYSTTTATYSSANATFTNTATMDSLGSFEPTSLTRSKSSKKSKSVETGRVEKGESSNQNFSNSYENFKYNVAHQVTFKILPLSSKNKTTQDIRQYCTECGTKTKTNFKFCPSCGNKL